jgi:hypothetical protein
VACGVKLISGGGVLMVACSINFEDTVVALLLCFAVAELLELLELLSDQGLGEWGNVVATSLANTSSVVLLCFAYSIMSMVCL